MVSKLFSFEKTICNMALKVSLVLMVISVSLAFYQVLTRFVFDTPSTWSEVGTRFSMVWCVFLAAPAAFRHGHMMSLEVLLDIMPKKVHVPFEFLSFACSILALYVLAYYGLELANRSKIQNISGLGISMYWLYLAIPVGCSLAIFSMSVKIVLMLVNPGEKYANG